MCLKMCLSDWIVVVCYGFVYTAMDGFLSSNRPLGTGTARVAWRECEGVEPSADGEGSLPADLKSVKPTGTHPLPRAGHLGGGSSNINVSPAADGPAINNGWDRPPRQ